MYFQGLHPPLSLHVEACIPNCISSIIQSTETQSVNIFASDISTWMLSQVPWTLHLKPTSIYFVLELAFTSMESILLIKSLKFKTTNAPLICCFIFFSMILFLSLCHATYSLLIHEPYLTCTGIHSFTKSNIFLGLKYVCYISLLYTPYLYFLGMKVIIYHIIEMHQLSNNWDVGRRNGNI